MSDLRTDILDAFENQKKLARDNPGVDPIPQLADDLAAAIANFVLAQKLQITKLKGKVEMDEIVTTKGPSVQVKPSTLLGPYGPVFDFFKNLAPALDLVTTGVYSKLFGQVENGVKAAAQTAGGDGGQADALKLKKSARGDSSALAMQSFGYVEMGQGSSFDDEGLSEESEIQLSRKRLAFYGGPTKKLRNNE